MNGERDPASERVQRVRRRLRLTIAEGRSLPQTPPRKKAMFKIIAAGLVAAAVLAAPVAGALAASTAPTVHKTKVVKAKPFALKTARLHRHRIGDPRHVRIVNAKVKHARLHAAPRVRI